MNTKLIKQWGEEILSYRLRTARNKKRSRYKDFHKFLIQINKEEEKLHTQKRNLGWEPLLPPVQKGWIRSFVLREDVARSRSANFYEEILGKINTWQISHRKDFKIRKLSFGKKIYVIKNQTLLMPEERLFAKLEFSLDEQELFYKEQDFTTGGRFLGWRYVFKEPWRFVLKVQPNIIYRIRKCDPLLDSRIQEINNYLERNDFRKKQQKLLSGQGKYSGWYEYEKSCEANPLKNKPIQWILNQATIHNS